MWLVRYLTILRHISWDLLLCGVDGWRIRRIEPSLIIGETFELGPTLNPLMSIAWLIAWLCTCSKFLVDWAAHLSIAHWHILLFRRFQQVCLGLLDHLVLRSFFPRGVSHRVRLSISRLVEAAMACVELTRSHTVLRRVLPSRVRVRLALYFYKVGSLDQRIALIIVLINILVLLCLWLSCIIITQMGWWLRWQLILLGWTLIAINAIWSNGYRIRNLLGDILRPFLALLRALFAWLFPLIEFLASKSIRLH